MTRRKRPLEPVTGVTYKAGTYEIIKIWYGRDVVVDVKRRIRCRYSAFSRRYRTLAPVDDVDIRDAVKQAKRWLLH